MPCGGNIRCENIKKYPDTFKGSIILEGYK